MRLYNVFNGNIDSKTIVMECFTNICYIAPNFTEKHYHSLFKYFTEKFGEPECSLDAKFWRLPLKHGFFLEIMFSRYGFYFDILTPKKEIISYSQYENGRHIGAKRKNEWATNKDINYEYLAHRYGFASSCYRYAKRIYRKEVQKIANDYKAYIYEKLHSSN